MSDQGLEISRQKIVEDVFVIPAELCSLPGPCPHMSDFSSQTKTVSSHHGRTDIRTMQGRIQHVVYSHLGMFFFKGKQLRHVPRKLRITSCGQ